MDYYLSEIDYGMKDSTEVRSNFHVMKETVRFLLMSVKPGEPVVGNCFKTVERSLANGTDDLCEMGSVQFNESVIDVIVQSAIITFWNFYYTWVSVLMDQSDLDFASIIIVIQTVPDPQVVRRSASFGRSQNINYGRNKTFIIWNEGPKVGQISPHFHQVSPLGTSFLDLKLNIRFFSLETSCFTPGDCC